MTKDECAQAFNYYDNAKRDCNSLYTQIMGEQDPIKLVDLMSRLLTRVIIKNERHILYKQSIAQFNMEQSNEPA